MVTWLYKVHKNNTRRLDTENYTYNTIKRQYSNVYNTLVEGRISVRCLSVIEVKNNGQVENNVKRRTSKNGLIMRIVERCGKLRKLYWLSTNQKVGGSNPSWRATKKA